MNDAPERGDHFPDYENEVEEDEGSLRPRPTLRFSSLRPSVIRSISSTWDGQWGPEREMEEGHARTDGAERESVCQTAS